MTPFLDAVGTGLAGVVFGLALAAPPGPMNAVIAEESVLRGWRAGFRAGLGAMVADLCFLVVSLAGVVTVVDRLPRLRALLFAVGGCLMVWFAIDAARKVGVALGSGSVEGPGKGFRKAFLLALTNPYQILFWLTAGVGLLTPGTHDLLSRVGLEGLLVVETGSPALLAGFFLGIGIWIVGFPAALVAARRRIERLGGLVAAGSALVLGAFGLAFLRAALAAL